MRAEAKRLVGILLGLAGAGAGYAFFLIPGEIAPGGFTGIAQILNRLTGVPVGLGAAILNVPVFLLAWRAVGGRYAVRSAGAAAAFSVLLDCLPRWQATGDPLLLAGFGGVLAGAGFGLILRGDATTGGVDLVAALAARKRPTLRIGNAVFALDAAIILASVAVYGAEKAMYALLSAFVINLSLTAVLDGPASARVYLVISGASEEIGRRVMREMGRGVTAIPARGMFSGRELEMLLCVSERREASRLRRILSQVDRDAFVVAAKATEVSGNGFRRDLSR